MSSTIHHKLTVLPGGKIEFSDPLLPSGRAVDVFVVVPGNVVSTERPSALDVLAQAPGHRLFQTPDEVDSYIEDERAAWDR